MRAGVLFCEVAPGASWGYSMRILRAVFVASVFEMIHFARTLGGAVPHRDVRTTLSVFRSGLI